MIFVPGALLDPKSALFILTMAYESLYYFLDLEYIDKSMYFLKFK